MEKTQKFTNETTEKLLDNYRRLYKKSGPCTLDTRLFPVSKYFDFNALLAESSQHSQDICVNSPYNLKHILIEKEWNNVCYNEALIKTYPTHTVIKNFKKWFTDNVNPKLQTTSMSDIAEYNYELKSFQHQMDVPLKDIANIQEYAEDNYEEDCDIVTFYIPFLVEDKSTIDTKMKSLVDALYVCGYNIASSERQKLGEDNYLKRTDVIVMQITFEPKFSTQDYKFSEFLYHVTPISNLKKINKYGLVPKFQQEFFKYPERVYLFNNYTLAEIIDYGMSKAYSRQQTEIALLKISSSKLTDDSKYKDGKMKFYLDKKYLSIDATQPVAVYTYNNVDRRFIEDDIVIFSFENGFVSAKRHNKLSDY